MLSEIGDKLRHCTAGCSISNYNLILKHAIEGKYAAIVVLIRDIYNKA